MIDGEDRDGSFSWFAESPFRTFLVRGERHPVKGTVVKVDYLQLGRDSIQIIKERIEGQRAAGKADAEINIYEVKIEEK